MNLLFGHSTDVYEATLEGDVAMAAGGVSMWGIHVAPSGNVAQTICRDLGDVIGCR